MSNRGNDCASRTSSHVTYMDYNSTTPVDRRVISAMEPVFGTWFGNPSSEYHWYGKDAISRVEKARAQVADLVGMVPPDVIFTSGATEANNLALRGVAEGSKRRARILVGSTEHKSSLEAAAALEDLGLAEVGTVPVDSDGITDCDALTAELTRETDLVSIMAANSETGVIQPVKSISEIAHAAGALYHCDATQILGRFTFSGIAHGADMVSLSSHKIYGPKGCGALVANKEARRRLRPLAYGGGQEGGLRSGTLNVPGIVGFGKACEIAASEGVGDMRRQKGMRDRLEVALSGRVPGVTVNGARAARLPNTSNVRIDGVSALAVIANVPNLAVSSGSACSSSAVAPSHVLLAMGMDDAAADESIRLSIGRPTTEADIDDAVSQVAAAVERIRGITGKEEVKALAR